MRGKCRTIMEIRLLFSEIEVTTLRERKYYETITTLF